MIDHGKLRSATLAAFACAAMLGTGGEATAFGRCGPSEFVERGDTVFGIAQRCGVSVEALHRANPELDPGAMEVGMRLAIPYRQTGGQSLHARSGDRVAALARMARVTGVPVQELIAGNTAFVAAEAPAGAETEYDEAPEGDQVRIVGRITNEGVECPAMRGSDGTLYSLAGAEQAFDVGRKVVVEGREAEMSFCMRGTTIAVDSITPAD